MKNKTMKKIYTGVKDREGIKIYSGDIIAYLDEDSIIGYNGFFKIQWDKEEARFGPDGNGGCAPEVMRNSIVVKNKKDIPKLKEINYADFSFHPSIKLTRDERIIYNALEKVFEDNGYEFY